MIEYRELAESEIGRELFRYFIRRQAVTKCWRRRGGQWMVEDDPFVDDWSEEDLAALLGQLRQAVRSGGFVYAAFGDSRLKGFVCVKRGLFGSAQQYLDLAELYVSADRRRQGIGRALFAAAKQWAKEHGAQKLYLSAHSAVESQAFYRSMGCVEAREYSRPHVEKEPFDCQLECVL